MSLSITHACTPEEREAVFRLRYTVLVEDGRRSSAFADHQVRCIEEPRDAAAHFVIARYDDTVVGALRLHVLTREDWVREAAGWHLDLVAEARPHATSISSVPLVTAGFKTSAVPARLVTAAYQWCLDEGIAHDFVAATPEYERFYAALGYRAYCGRVQRADRTNVLPMMLPLRDRAHLAASASPLLAVLPERPRAGRPDHVSS